MEELIKINNIKKSFPKIKSPVINGASVSIFKGETLGLVGESGCGKTTFAKAVLRLTSIQEGSVFYKGEDILKVSDKKMRRVRKSLQVIFQDPYASLDPSMRVGDLLEEVYIIHYYHTKDKRMRKIVELLETVGLGESYLKRLPSELSGGERQRIGIARSLALEPEFIICDEPVSSLDISIQAQILNLLMDLQKKINLTYLFISHDLAVVASICDRVVVMHKGSFIEIGPCDDIFNDPKMDYTKNLIEASKLHLF